jgi:hypothetical protein
MRTNLTALAATAVVIDATAAGSLVRFYRTVTPQPVRAHARFQLGGRPDAADGSALRIQLRQGLNLVS